MANERFVGLSPLSVVLLKWPGWAALALFIGFACGGWLGAWAALRGGERIIRPVMALAVVAMAGRMLDLY